MSITDCPEPACSNAPSTPAVATIIDARNRDVAGFPVRRLLPSSARRLVGPFAFFDHMGPVALAPGAGMDVPPHPHIGLATVTYLFEGELLHRDSLGSHQPIRPGDINWMTAGSGIVHSERTPMELRGAGPSLHGLQLWVALPQAEEECAPSFHHYSGAALPRRDVGGVGLRVLAGGAYGLVSPVKASSPLFYVDAVMPAGSSLSLPEEHEERALYVVDGALACGAERARPGRMLVFARGAKAEVRAESAARIVLIGGAPLDGPRYHLWNFVSSSKERLEQAKRDWKDGRFARVPGDERDFVPFPE